jgi:hypothetical protein
MGSCDHFTHPSLFNRWTFQHLMCLCTNKNLESKNAGYFGDLPKYNFLLPAIGDYMQFPCHRRLHAISVQQTKFLVREFVPFFLMHWNSSDHFDLGFYTVESWIWSFLHHFLPFHKSIWKMDYHNMFGHARWICFIPHQQFNIFSIEIFITL